MKLSKETIEEFKEIYKRKEGKELSDKEALEIASNLLLAFEAIYHPIPSAKNKAPRESKEEPKGKPMQYLTLNDTINL